MPHISYVAPSLLGVETFSVKKYRKCDSQNLSITSEL